MNTQGCKMQTFKKKLVTAGETGESAGGEIVKSAVRLRDQVLALGYQRTLSGGCSVRT